MKFPRNPVAKVMTAASNDLQSVGRKIRRKVGSAVKYDKGQYNQWKARGGKVDPMDDNAIINDKPSG